MTRYTAIFLFALLSLYYSSLWSSEEEDDDEIASPVQTIDGQTVIFLEQDVQALAGITTQRVQQVEYQPEYIAYGEIISIEPLIETLAQYLSASAKQAGAKARFSAAENNINRLRRLHKDEAVSTRKLQQQQSELLSNQAIYNEMRLQTQLIKKRNTLKWGDTLTQWATSQNSRKFDQLLNGQAKLVKIILPAHRIDTETLKSIVIDPGGNRQLAVKADYLDTLPQVDNFSQGQQILFITHSPVIKTGMSVSAWIAEKQQKQTGFIIPDSALIWHLGQACVFIKSDTEQFVHRNINNPRKIPTGYFIHDQINEGDAMVVTGAQMLLSHEFRALIPDEDDD